MSGKKAAGALVSIVGNVTLESVKTANKHGDAWVGAVNTAFTTAQTYYPTIDGIKIHGAKAHQSNQVQSHANVISAALYAGNNRVVSAHIHADGSVDFSKAFGTSGGSSSQAKASSSQSGKPGKSARSGKKSSEFSFATGLDWRTNDRNEVEWWDGSTWQAGEWSAEHQKWVAYYNEEWYAWE